MAVTSNAIPNVLSIVSSSLNNYAGKLYMSDNPDAKYARTPLPATLVRRTTRRLLCRAR